jgi:hypothetical protein
MIALAFDCVAPTWSILNRNKKKDSSLRSEGPLPKAHTPVG